MRYLLFIVLFALINQTSFSQDSSGRFADSQQRADILARSIHLQDSLDSVETYRSLDRNMSSFVRMQQERNKKEKKQAMIRIAIGVGFLALLIVTTIRRRRKAKKTAETSPRT